jgi:UDP-N-acetylglucosamine--N-acetylmuramyl-(pentapeptide) pyrophosphoryl-undecaprenol N-acetylglucosamine transferase
MKKSNLSILFAGGGTGGHLYPALAVADEMKRRCPTVSIRFIGADRGIETRLVPESGYPLRTLPLRGMKGAGLTGKIGAVFAAALAVFYCISSMLRSRPDLVIGVGGYASGPAVLAARLLMVRTMILEQNHFPGATNRWLAGWVNRICVPSEAARVRFGNRGEVTGNPVRSTFSKIGEPPLAERLSILVFGGSRGAHSINTALIAAAGGLATMPAPPAIVHQTGEDDLESVREAYRSVYPDGLAEAFAYLDDMPARLAQSDFVISRAGATTLAELAAAGRGALLVPYPHAADDHQYLNAQAVVEAGGARMIADAELCGDRITELITELDSNRPELSRMGHAARALAIPDAAGRITSVAEDLLGIQGGAHVS